MLLSLRKNGLTSLFKEVRVFKEGLRLPRSLFRSMRNEGVSDPGSLRPFFPPKRENPVHPKIPLARPPKNSARKSIAGTEQNPECQCGRGGSLSTCPFEKRKLSRKTDNFFSSQFCNSLSAEKRRQPKIHQDFLPFFNVKSLKIFWRAQKSGTKKEPKPKLLSPDIFWWGGGLPREGAGAKKFGMSLETQGIKLFWRDIPGFCRDITAPLPKQQRDGFPLEFLLKGPQKIANTLAEIANKLSNTIRGNRTREGNLPLRGSLRGPLRGRVFRGFQTFFEVFRDFQRSSQRPSQRQISLSEALGPVAPTMGCITVSYLIFGN